MSTLLFSTSVELHTQKCMYVCMSGCPDVCLFWPKFIWFCLHTVWGTPWPFGECFKPKIVLTRPAPCAPDPFFWYFGVIFPETLARRSGLIWDLVVWIFVFTASLGISLGVIFFVWPNFDFWAQGRGSKLVPEPQKSKTVKNGRKNLKKSPKILKNI